MAPSEPRIEERIEHQSRPPEEVIQELVGELERPLESSQLSEVLERFSDLHLVDQGEILYELPRELRAGCSWPN